jgi:hypothetical protein
MKTLIALTGLLLGFMVFTVIFAKAEPQAINGAAATGAAHHIATSANPLLLVQPPF